MPTAATDRPCPAKTPLRACLLTALLLVLVGLASAAPDFELMEKLAGQRFGADGRARVGEWRTMLAASGGIPEEEKFRAANDFINKKTRFSNDAAIWGQTDYWATPMETLGMGRGDCEDFSIAKYTTLRLLGIPGEKLRLTYVKAKIGGMYSQITEAHMVLSYYPSPTAEPLILDNLIADIRPASQRPDLYPIFSFSMENLWIGTNAAPAADATSRLSRWRDVLTRMRAEGLSVLFEQEKKAAPHAGSGKT